MKISNTPLRDAFVLEPNVLNDARGYFFESYNQATFQQLTGLDIHFVQDNQARSTQHVLRGLHFQNPPYAQSKLVRVLEGVIWDVIVDMRKKSETFGQWYGVELSSENKLQLFVPKGFAHGYAVLSGTAEVFYKCDNLYNKASESGIIYNDPQLNIDWRLNLDEAIISDKDKLWHTFEDVEKLF